MLQATDPQIEASTATSAKLHNPVIILICAITIVISIIISMTIMIMSVQLFLLQ